MNSFIARKYSNKVKTDGVNQSNINGTKLCSYPFPLCSMEEQKQVVFELGNRLVLYDKIASVVFLLLAHDIHSEHNNTATSKYIEFCLTINVKSVNEMTSIKNPNPLGRPNRTKRVKIGL